MYGAMRCSSPPPMSKVLGRQQEASDNISFYLSSFSLWRPLMFPEGILSILILNLTDFYRRQGFHIWIEMIGTHFELHS